MAGLKSGMLCLPLLACAAVQPVAVNQALFARCGADLLVGFVGQPVATLPAQPADRSVRILRPGDPVTEDFSDARLNLILDARDRLTALSCG